MLDPQAIALAMGTDRKTVHANLKQARAHSPLQKRRPNVSAAIAPTPPPRRGVDTQGRYETRQLSYDASSLSRSPHLRRESGEDA